MFETCTVAICGAGAESSPESRREQTARCRRARDSAGKLLRSQVLFKYTSCAVVTMSSEFLMVFDPETWPSRCNIMECVVKRMLEFGVSRLTRFGELKKTSRRY